MMGYRRYIGALLLVAIAAGAAHAATDSPMIIADAGKSVAPQRFISLDNARHGLAGVRTVPAAMRSDRAMLQSGYMRIDRARMPIVHRVPSRPVAVEQAKIVAP